MSKIIACLSVIFAASTFYGVNELLHNWDMLYCPFLHYLFWILFGASLVLLLACAVICALDEIRRRKKLKMTEKDISAAERQSITE